MARKKLHINRAREAMQELGIYKPEFEPIIEVYGQLREQYDVLTRKFIASGYQYEVATTQGWKKAPIVTTLESMRKDILAYAGQLGLTPSGLLKMDDKAFATKKKSALTDIMKGLDGS